MFCRSVSLFIMALSLSACSVSPPVDIVADEYLHDGAFAGYQYYPVETEQQVFRLDDQVINYLDSNILTEPDPVRRMYQLYHQLFDPQKINLLYQTDANSVASDTFNRQTANCLSMSILAYSMAEYAGLKVVFRDVDIPEFWNVRDDVSFLNGHINLAVTAIKLDEKQNPVALESIEVDFSDSFSSNRFAKTIISQQTALAMFYNNKGAEALVKKEYNQAYAYFRRAVMLAPQYVPGLSNLGVLYRLTEHPEWAEQVYLAGLRLDNDNRNVLDNMVVLLEHTNRQEQANQIRWRINQQRQSNPYYHYYLGQQEYHSGHWRKAIRHFRRAQSLNQNDHQFYFGLAKAYFELGKVKETRRNLTLAKRYAVDNQQSDLYATKLALLH